MKLIMQFDIDGLAYEDISEIFSRHTRVADGLGTLSVEPTPGDTHPVYSQRGEKIGGWEVVADAPAEGYIITAHVAPGNPSLARVGVSTVAELLHHLESFRDDGYDLDTITVEVRR